MPGTGSDAPREHPRATLVLVLGLVSLLGLCCGPVSLAGLAAILFANTARREVSASGGRLLGGSKLTAGFVCGIIGLAVGVLWVVALLVRR